MSHLSIMNENIFIMSTVLQLSIIILIYIINIMIIR